MSANETLNLDESDRLAHWFIREGHEVTVYTRMLALSAAVRERDAEIARLTTALRTYGEHRAHCDMLGGTKPCVCGLGEALHQTGTEPPQPAEGA